MTTEIEIEIRGAIKGMGYPTARLTLFRMRLSRRWCALLVSPTSSATMDELELFKELRKLGMETAIVHSVANAIDYVEQWEDELNVWRDDKQPKQERNEV